MVPLPTVWSLVNPDTVFPDGAGRLSTDTLRPHANSPTGCRTGWAGGVRIHSLMSARVTSPSVPLGFTTAKGRNTDDPAPTVEDDAGLLFLQLSSPFDSFSVRKRRNEISKKFARTLRRFSVTRVGKVFTFWCRALGGQAVGANSSVLGATSSITGTWVPDAL
ncbi:hypothetical protein PR202_gb02949 [Eleusine coracana subsp. coracana]|uniref:Uncharacterized protein n=1 Tax=Eleusine coracana subsp. coracana TaxID=191504 RepID=A0AAV5DZ39_ELECO|nr:hypothetical protein PR202_gb02949 [Eleusine coracana subsp. coracana]